MKKIVVVLLIAIIISTWFLSGQASGDRAYLNTVIDVPNKQAIVLSNGNWWKYLRDFASDDGMGFLSGCLEGMLGEYALIHGKGNEDDRGTSKELNEIADMLDYFYENPSYRIIPIIFVIDCIVYDKGYKDEFAKQFIKKHNMKYGGEL